MSNTAYGYLADFVVACHLAYVGYVVIGLLFILLGGAFGWTWTRHWLLRLVHLVMIWIVAIEAVLHITCPLTTWEQQLRGKADQKVSERTFVGRMMDRIIFVDYWEPEEAHVAIAPTATPAAVPTTPAPPMPAVAATPAPSAAFPTAPPPEADLTAIYVVIAVFTSMLYMTEPPRRNNVPPLAG